MYFSRASSLAGKKMECIAKKERFVNKSHLREPIRLKGSPVVLKMDVIKIGNQASPH